jgi:uncharacterized protein YjlB
MSGSQGARTCWSSAPIPRSARMTSAALRKEKEHDRARSTIPKVALPRKDPVYGRDGPLMTLWRRH